MKIELGKDVRINVKETISYYVYRYKLWSPDVSADFTLKIIIRVNTIQNVNIRTDQ